MLSLRKPFRRRFGGKSSAGLYPTLAQPCNGEAAPPSARFRRPRGAEGAAQPLGPLGGAFLDFAALALPFEHASTEPNNSAPMPLSPAVHLRPARRPVLERRSLIEIQDECQKAAYHKHDRN